MNNYGSIHHHNNVSASEMENSIIAEELDRESENVDEEYVEKIENVSGEGS